MHAAQAMRGLPVRLVSLATTVHADQLQLLPLGACLARWAAVPASLLRRWLIARQRTAKAL
jgi:hypothetical protein